MLAHKGDTTASELSVPREPSGSPSPLTTLSPPITRNEILVITKMSKFDRERAEKKASPEEAADRFRALGESGLRVLAAHLHHQESVERCKKEIPPHHVVSLEEFTKITDLSRFKLVVALGGDDFFKLVAHAVLDSLPILGVNSDPASSAGALLPSTIEELSETLTKLEQGRYQLSTWTRLSLTLNGVAHGSAINDIVLGKLNFLLTSRHELEYKGEKVVQRSSGILISTGTGSTGWYSSAGLYLGTHDRSFPNTARVARFELREPAISVIRNPDGTRSVRLPKFVEGSIGDGETLRITSLNDEGGVASRDSLETLPFPRGAVAEISLDPNPLVVLIPEGAPC
jgi:NAD kinase